MAMTNTWAGYIYIDITCISSRSDYFYKFIKCGRFFSVDELSVEIELLILDKLFIQDTCKILNAKLQKSI